MKIIPCDDTITDLKKKAAEYEELARKQTGPVAERLREKALQCRRWLLALKFGQVDLLKQANTAIDHG